MAEEKAALFCQLSVVPWGSYHTYESLEEVAIFILTIQEQCMKELVWKSSSAVTRLFKLSCKRVSLAPVHLNFILKISGVTLT